MTQAMKDVRRISPIFAALLIIGVLGGTMLDVPWAGIAGWGIAFVAALAWLLTALWRPRPRRHG